MAGSSIRGLKPNLIIIHTGEGILDKDDMAAFLNRSDDASAHAASDSDGVVAPLVPYDRAAWTAGPTANSRGIQIELCAFAVMTRQQWLSKTDVSVWVPHLKQNRTIKKPYDMLVQTADWARTVANQFQIPKIKLSASQIRAGQGGICGHADTSEAWKETDHTDPGAGFPWDVFIDLINEKRQEEDDFLVALPQWQQERIYDRIIRMSMGKAGENFNGEQFAWEEKNFATMNETLKVLSAKLDGLVAAVAALSNNGDLDVTAVKDIINQAVKDNLKITGTVQVGNK